MPWTVPPELPWAAEGLTIGEIVSVLPTCVSAAAPSVSYEEALAGAMIPVWREVGREERTVQVAEVPVAFGWALPGEIGVATEDRWEGRFEVGRAAPVDCRRLGQALARGERLDPILAGFASELPVLVTWVDELDGRPISADEMPGELVLTAAGPVISDLFAEPYRVRMHVGAALVSPEGHVIVRISDDVEALLTDHLDAPRAGRVAARVIAEDVAKLWPCDERLAQR